METAVRERLSPETRVILLSAGPPATDTEIADLLRGGVDWRVLAATAHREKAVPVLWRRIQRLGIESIPAQVAGNFQTYSRLAEFRQDQLRQRLLEALDTLSDAGVEPVLLKGAALACTAYDSFLDRPMSDIDLLVDSDGLLRGWQALLDAEWRRVDDGPTPIDWLRHHHLPPLLARGLQGIRLELHRALFSTGHPFTLAVSSFRERSRSLEFEGRRVLVPDPEDMVHHLSAHFGWSDGLTKGAWLAFRDLERLAASGQVEWPELVDRMAGTAAATCCYWTFRLARELAAVDIPEEAIRSLRPRLPDSMIELLARHFALQLVPGEAFRPPSPVRRAAWTLGFQPVWSGHSQIRPWNRKSQADRMLTHDAGSKSGRRPIRLLIRQGWEYLLRVAGERPSKITGVARTGHHAGPESTAVEDIRRRKLNNDTSSTCRQGLGLPAARS